MTDNGSIIGESNWHISSTAKGFPDLYTALSKTIRKYQSEKD